MFDPPLHVGRPNVGSRAHIHTLVDGMLDRGWLTNSGPLVVELEGEIARLCAVDHCIATANGTIALEIVTRALQMSGEVIVPAFTFVATAHALAWQGAVPVFADINPTTHQVDPESIRRCVTEQTTGIVAVHLWGNPAPAHELERLAGDLGVPLVFDAAHAFATRVKGRPIGSFGNAEVFSFHATKVFNTLEGGAIVTNDADLANRVRLMRNFGFVDYDEVVHPGTNGKMNEASAAVGLTNLASLPAFLARNAENYAAYDAVLAESAVATLVAIPPGTSPNHHYVVLELADDLIPYRDRLIADLHAIGVIARRYFWPGCHQMQPYAKRPADVPVTDAVARRVVVLPTGMAVTPEMCTSIARFIVDRAALIREPAASPSIAE